MVLPRGPTRKNAGLVIQTPGFVQDATQKKNCSGRKLFKPLFLVKPGGDFMDGMKEIETQTITGKVKAVCEKEYEHCFELLSRLIACKSYSGQEEECAEVLMTYFSTRNIPAMKDERGSVLAVSLPAELVYEDFPDDLSQRKAWFKGLLNLCNDRSIKTLAYNAHMDVVPAEDTENWSKPPFKATRRDGRVYGRGTCDMKGALAAMATSLTLMRDLDKDLSRNQLVIGCFCTEEEAGEGLAFKELCEEFRFRPDMVILGEPSQMQIARGQRGKLEFNVETRGCCAHTSVPEAGDNAAYKIARVLLAIENLEEQERFKFGLSESNTLKRNTLVATSVKTWPPSKSFVPDRALVHVTARTALGCSFTDLKQRLESSEDWPDAKIVPIFYRGKSYTGKNSEWPSDHPAWETEVDHNFFQKLKIAFSDLFCSEPKDKIWPFSTDGVYSAGMAGIPTLGIGPGMEKCAHIVDEWVSEQELQNALALYTYLGFYRF
jgi:putative selenium metabolism hydrolase